MLSHRRRRTAVNLRAGAQTGLASIDRGILMGAATAVLLYLYRSMNPRVVILGRRTDEALEAIFGRIHDESFDAAVCPLRRVEKTA